MGIYQRDKKIKIFYKKTVISMTCTFFKFNF